MRPISLIVVSSYVRDYFQSGELLFDLPFFDNLGDTYTVVVWAKGYKQAGFTPVLLSDTYEKTLDIMLVPDDPGFSFADAKWDVIAPLYPFLGAGVDAEAAATRCGDLIENTEVTLPCILNLCEAMSQIVRSQGTRLTTSSNCDGTRRSRPRRTASSPGVIRA
jgi:hypothetical protein